jgi:DNA polymerase-3 subunit gamma/tau
MLTTEAFNALLKTLEEPPPQVTFILATTELHKVPSTILSRCQHFNFRAISYHEVLGQLKKIAEEEHIQISDEALNAIARASEGSMRDAQSQLDQIIAFCGDAIKDEQVRDLLGIVPQQMLDDFTNAIVQQDARKVLMLIDQLVASGLNLQHFVREMLGHFRNLLMLKIAGEDPKLIPLAPAEMGRARATSVHFSEEDLTRFFQILVTAEGEMRGSSQPRFHLEMALTRVLHARRLVPLEELINQLGGVGQLSSPEPPGKASTQLPQAPSTSRFTAAAPARALAELPASPAPVRGGFIESLKAAVAQRSPLVSSLLEHAHDFRQTSAGVEIEFGAPDRFSLEMLQSAENFRLLKEIADSVAGKPQTVKLVLESTWVGEIPSPPETVAVDSKKELLERVKKDANVKAFLETFHGEITDVRDLK